MTRVHVCHVGMHKHEQLLITIDDLTRMGMTTNDIRGKLKEGALVRIRRGVYAMRHLEDPEERHRRLIQAALTAVDEGTVVSHVSAAVLHGLPVPRKHYGRVTVTRRSSGHGSHREHLVVRRPPLDDDEVTVIDGVAVTSLARTVVDLARTSPFEWGVMAADAALHTGEVTQELLLMNLARHPRMHHSHRVRSVVRFADGRSESPAESLSRANMAAAGIPIPQLQVEIFNAAGEFIGRTDFLWEELRLIGEVDGQTKYRELLKPGETADDVRKNQARRDEGFRQNGYWVMHWDYGVAGDKDVLGRMIRNSMANQARQLGIAFPG